MRVAFGLWLEIARRCSVESGLNPSENPNGEVLEGVEASTPVRDSSSMRVSCTYHHVPEWTTLHPLTSESAVYLHLESFGEEGHRRDYVGGCPGSLTAAMALCIWGLPTMRLYVVNVRTTS